MIRKAKELAADGKTNSEIADIFGVAESTWYVWLTENRELSEALREGKQEADDLVEASLFRRAVGFVAPETKVFTYEGEVITHEIMRLHPPSVDAQKFWLKNRRPDSWQEQSDAPAGPVQVSVAYKPKSERDDDDPDQ